MRPKPKRLNNPISRPPQAIRIDVGKATKTTIIDEEVALQAQVIGEIAAKKQNSKGGNKASFAPKPRLRMNRDSDLVFVKKSSVVAGEKRKRGDVPEQPNKRPAV